jgi:glutamate-ammonia-ligase adenylyltransferase
MPRDVWKHAIANAPAPDRARKVLEQLHTNGGAGVLVTSGAEQARVWAALWSGSEWAADILQQQPDWLAELTPEKLRRSRPLSSLRQEVTARFATQDHAESLAQLRRFKQREMIRIAARDLARLAPTAEIILEISNVADVCLGAILAVTLQQLTARFGQPWEQDANGTWRETKCCVLGLGKLGGQELNYSSDVDLLFAYSDEGGVFKEPPRRGKSARPVLTNHQFFTRVAEMFISEVSRLTEDGMLFRIDLRLRPEGDAGPLVRSLASYENYYAQWGQTWERMMLLKARAVAGDAALAGEFMEMVQPFRYPRFINENVLGEIAAMKHRIENEVLKGGELERNVKLGRGGIREIEFIVQTLQLLHGGKNPFLQTAQTLSALNKLVQYHLLPPARAGALARAYSFLRDVEHRLQMEHNRQTHSLPVAPTARSRLARLMGFADWKSFEKARNVHAKNVRTTYERLLQASKAGNQSSLPEDFDRDASWHAVLERHSFRDSIHATTLLKEFALGPGYGHVSARTTELAMQLIRQLLAFCPPAAANTVLSDPDRVLARLDTFVSAYGARATLYEMWSRQPSLFELMLLLFDRSEFLAEVAIRTPDLVDELVLSGHLRRRKDAGVILAELRHGAHDADQRLWLRRYHQSELMRIGLRDILGLADYEQNFDELSALASACLAFALEVVMRRHRITVAPFAVIGWGKLGGAELNYGSDLDLTFVARDGVKNLPKLQSLAAQLMDLISSPTELGVAFITDARLRPDGQKGLLVNTVGAYRDYYRRRAALWEIQSLTRTRLIAGDKTAGGQFETLANGLTDFTAPSTIAAFTPDWKSEIAKMRLRIEKERVPVGQDALAIKTGSGGLIEAEFIAQAMCLENGWHEPNTLAALRRARSERSLNEHDAEKLIENYRRLRRIEAILRRWSFAGETVLPKDPAPLYRVAVRCGFRNAEEFMTAINRWRRAIRAVYAKVFAG